MVEPGRRCLDDRYELQQLIAAGGMGQVWRGLDVLLGRPVAVKALRSEYTADPTFLARFRAEAQHAASLSHPNIAAVYDYGEVVARDGSGETLAYLVMELVQGEPLSAVLRGEVPLPLATSLSILRQAAAALADAHRVGLVHRDVKPGNILVTPDGGVKITDFGIAWSAGSVPLTRTGQVIGTAQYLSPEQAEGRHATPASDVYALGLVGYECLTGRAAFNGDNPVTIALKQVREQPEPLPGNLPAGVRGLVMRALAKQPEDRYPDGAAFAAAVDDAAAGRSTAAVSIPPGAVRRPSRPRAGADVPARVWPGAGTGSAHIGPPVRRRPPVTAVLVPVVALLVGAVIATFVLQGLAGEGSPSPAAATNTLDAGRGIVLDARDYIGRTVDEVAGELSHRGLSVQRRPVQAPDGLPGTVTDVAPAGAQLSLGDPVTVFYLAADPAPGAPPAPRTAAAVAEPGTFSAAAPTHPTATSPPPSPPATSPPPPPPSPPPTPTGTAEEGAPAPTGEPTDSATPTGEPTDSATPDGATASSEPSGSSSSTPSSSPSPSGHEDR